MTGFDAIDLLNELLAEESRSLLARLPESTIFVSWASADDVAEIKKMIANAEAFRGSLVAAINNLGADPAPVWGDIRFSNMHFVELESVLPHTLEDEKRLLQIYEAGAAAAADNEHAARVISSVIEARRRHIEVLTRLCQLATSKTT